MKMEKDITKITKDNYKTDESWVEYLKIDVLGLAYAIQKINTKVIKEVGLDITPFLTQGQSAYNYWLNYLTNEEGENVYYIDDPKANYIIRKTVTGGRVISNNRHFSIFEDDYGSELAELVERIGANEDNSAWSIDIDRSNPYYNRIKGAIIEEECILDLDATSLYPSAQYLKTIDGFPVFYPVTKSARVIVPGEFNDLINSNPLEFHKQFIVSGEFEFDCNPNLSFPLFHQKVGKRKVWGTGHMKLFTNSPEVVWALDKGYITNVRIGEDAIVFKSGESPFAKVIKKLFDLRMTYANDPVMKFAIKVMMNSIYGKTCQRTPKTIEGLFEDNKELEKQYNPKTMTLTPFLDTNQYIVSRPNPEKYNEKAPIALGTCTLSYSKILMNTYIHAINGFIENKVYYSDTDSIFVPAKDEQKIIECAKRITGAGDKFFENLGGIKNDLGEDCGIIWYESSGMKQKYLLTAKIKNENEITITLKKTFKGMSKKSLPTVPEYVNYAKGNHLYVPLEEYKSFPIQKKIGEEPKICNDLPSYIKWCGRKDKNDDPIKCIEAHRKRLMNGEIAEIPENCRFYEYNWYTKQEDDFKPFIFGGLERGEWSSPEDIIAERNNQLMMFNEDEDIILPTEKDRICSICDENSISRRFKICENGHKVCIICYDKIMDSSGKCPFCRVNYIKEFDIENVEGYGVDFW